MGPVGGSGLADGYWDRRYTEDPDAFGPMASSLARAALGPLLRDTPGGRLVELACGTGRDLCYFAQHGFDVEGCDRSAVAARFANQRLADLRAEVPPVGHVRVMDALDYLATLPAGRVDAVFSNLYLNLEIEPERVARVFRSTARVVRAEGWAFLSARSTSDPWFGRGSPLGPSVFDPGESRPALRFFSEPELRELAVPEFEVAWIREHGEGEPDFPVVVWSVALRRRA